MPFQATVLRVLILADEPAERHHVLEVLESVGRVALKTKNLVLHAELDAACQSDCDLVIGAPAEGSACLCFDPGADLEQKLQKYVSDIAVQLAVPRESASGSGSTMAVLKHVVDSIADGSAGWAFRVADEKRKHYWVKNTLQTVLEVYVPRAKDAYVVWLKPVVDKERLTVYEYQNLPLMHDHYEFRLGEGLAGKVWETGDAAVHSRTHAHPWWIKRHESEGLTYLCVAVGTCGAEGVLAVGSYLGFELQPGDGALLATFASLLKLGACL